jgi:polar amino acid transport system substrate-binding protein
MQAASTRLQLQLIEGLTFGLGNRYLVSVPKGGLVTMARAETDSSSGVAGPTPGERPALRGLLPIDQLQALFDAFNAFFPAVTAILDLDGEVLQASGWQDICTKFHRANPDSCRNCTESDTFLARNVKPGEFVEYRCKNGMWDVVTPLFVGGAHAGNLYTGQFFYEDEQIDEARFEEQARRFGYDSAAYLEALRRVPRVQRGHVEQVMTFLTRLTSLLSQVGLAQVTLAKDLEERQQLFDELHLEQEQRRALERQVLEAQKRESLGLLAGGIAHDFNNLLTAISANLEVAKAEVGEGSEASAALHQGLVATHRASDLTRQLLAYSGRGRFSVESVDVGRLLQENAQMLRAAVPRTIELQVDVAPGLPPVFVDRAQLQQVVMNLLINGAEAIGPKPGTVWLTAREAELTDDVRRANRLATNLEGRVVLL